MAGRKAAHQAIHAALAAEAGGTREIRSDE
jgi:hypothetical protein